MKHTILPSLGLEQAILYSFEQMQKVTLKLYLVDSTSTHLQIPRFQESISRESPLTSSFCKQLTPIKRRAQFEKVTKSYMRKFKSASSIRRVIIFQVKSYYFFSLEINCFKEKFLNFQYLCRNHKFYW